jgi:hypothetical protein
MIPRRVQLAVLLALLFHGLFIVTARYRLSYDAYVHMFFADHYAKGWWSLWDTRWYTGFFVSSYPPLVHQLIALCSLLIGLDPAYALVLWVTVTLYPLGVYALSRVFVGKTISGYAALGAAFLPSLYLTAHVFGQLPFLFSTMTALFGAASLARYLREGGLHNFVLTIALASMTTASHHATLLVQPLLVFAVATNVFLGHTPAAAGGARGNTKASSLIRTSARQWMRLLLFILFAVIASLIVVFPFWEWGLTQTMQTPIDHLSRHNFIEDPLAIVLFFLPMYGPLILIFPYAFTRNRRLIGLVFAFIILFLLGLGGTTPLPRLFFGPGWAWLTYDRFAVWASLTLLPFLGIAAGKLRNKISSPMIFGALAMTSLIVGFVTTLIPLQPGKVDMKQVVDFLNQDDRARYRYLTFGFGDQLALLSTLTTATTIDGSYHTARTLPELRSSGIAQIDTVYWSPKGLSALDPILQKASEHGVRWGFVNIPQYIPILNRNGWVKIETLQGGVQVWENPNAVLPGPSSPPSSSPLASFAWGTFPLLSLLTTLSLAAFRLYPIQAEKVLQGIYSFLMGLMPLGLCFWYYRTLVENPHGRIYFTYTNALFFLADGLAAVAIVFWSATRILHHTSGFTDRTSRFVPLLLAFSLLASLSTLWSSDRKLSFYLGLHWWLVFALFLSLMHSPHVWKTFAYGCCAALTIQFITGFAGFVDQSTASLAPLHMDWPGTLDPSVPGASVVHLLNGESVLRAYGTLPHPNILGGLVTILFLGPTALFLRKEKPNGIVILVAVLGASLLAITFSRSAWLAMIAFALVLIWKSRYFNQKRLALLLVIIAVSFALTLLPYRQLVQARTTNITSPSEEFSFIGRIWLGQEALQMLRERPLTGVGIGSFILELSRRAGEGYVIEPAHNIVLLAGAELGIPGLLLVVALSVSFIYHLFKTQHPNAILAGAILAGLGVIGLLDHYLWTLAPCRLTLGLMLGLFFGQINCSDASLVSVTGFSSRSLRT